jgi:hypothetical protein
MKPSAVKGYLQYFFGELTPFEESLIDGRFEMPEGFTLVQAGKQPGYLVESGGSGARHHVIYNRDGTVFEHTVSETPLVSEGIGPLALALPGGVRGMTGTGAAVARQGLSLGRKFLTVLRQPLRNAAVSMKLAIGRAEAGAAFAESTAVAGFASRNSITLTEAGAASSAAERTIAPITSEVSGARAAVEPLPSASRIGTQPVVTTAPSIPQAPSNIAPTIAAAVATQTTIPAQVQIDARHARGYGGEQSMGFNLYPAERGWFFVEGPSGSAGHGVTTSGFDGVAYNPNLDLLDVIDNKSLGRSGNVSSATAIDPAKNLGQNLDATIGRVQAMPWLPHQARILQLLISMRQAMANGTPFPDRVRLVVTHEGGQTTDISAGLAARGVISR